MTALDKLFGSPVRVKLLKLFLFNPDQSYSSVDLVLKTKASSPAIRKELRLLENTSFIKRKGSLGSSAPTKNKKAKGRKIQIKKINPTWKMNLLFPFRTGLHELLSGGEIFGEEEILKLLNKVGRIKLLTLSGVFLNDADSRLDVLIVGDHLKQKSLENAISIIESETGREIRYASFATKDFNYRLSVYDKLIRDVLDFPHRKLVNKLGL